MIAILSKKNPTACFTIGGEAEIELRKLLHPETTHVDLHVRERHLQHGELPMIQDGHYYNGASLGFISQEELTNFFVRFESVKKEYELWDSQVVSFVGGA